MPAGVDSEYAREIGRAIAEARRAMGMSQDDLRRRVGKSKTAVSNWERGVSAPTVQNVRELCRVLAVAPERLLGLNGDMRPAVPGEPSTDVRRLAERLSTLRQDAERAVPPLLNVLREAEREARRLN